MRRFLGVSGVSICIAAVAAAVASAAAEPGTKYKGRTSQGQNVSLRTNAIGNGVKSFAIRREFTCATEAGEETVVGTFRQSSGALAIRENGRFRGTANVQKGGEVKRGVFTIAGRFGRRGGAARGTYRERIRLTDGTRCDTGDVRFRVSAPD